MRKVIGIIPLYDDEKESYWMLPGYMKVIEKCGALPIMLPLTTDKSVLDDAYALCDGLLFTGGHDVDPAVYGEEKKKTCGITCPERDVMEAYLLDKSIGDDKPFLGICRGIQFVNAHLGGSLYQDLPSEYVNRTEDERNMSDSCDRKNDIKVDHHMSAPYDRKAHYVDVLEGSLLADIIGAGKHEVNSYHHQAVKRLADSASVMALSEDGLVEAIRVKNMSFGLAVQWHPEFSYQVSEDSMKIVRAFVEALDPK